MEKLHKIHFTLFLFLFIQFSYLSSAYTLPDHYFINCGSERGINFSQRLFVSDHHFFEGPSSTVKDSSQAAGTSIYQTARVFYKHTSSYQFIITERGTYVLRLHFFVFSSPRNLANALFNVWTSGFMLLSNFSVPESINLPLIKEFLLTINVGKFVIYFTSCDGSSLAFVNAIEVYLAPERFIPDNTTQIISAGSYGNYSGLLSQVLHNIYRINVGGSTILEDKDTLWRNWITDDDFLSYPGNARNISLADGWLINRNATRYAAPESVYRTAKNLSRGAIRQSNFSNITWGLRVKKNARYFVRVHFCNIISLAPEVLQFNLHVSSNFSQKINPFNITGFLQSPFYFDYVVDIGASEFMNITVESLPESEIKDAFLNGLEIMEVMGKSGSVPPQSKPKMNSGLIIVGVLGGGAFLLISFLLMFLFYKAYQTPGKLFSLSLLRGRFKTEGTAKIPLSSDLNLDLKIPYSEVKRATKKFSSKLLIGEGGFGKVYRATLQRQDVAVKRSEPGNGQGLKEFQNEIMLLSQIRHRNLVSLVGYCDESSQMILVYEYMEKGTLRDHLYVTDEDSGSYSPRSKLTWEERLKICIDSANGLNYLHTCLERSIIHRDVKSTNILLTENYTAKVADFGLSISGPLDPEQDDTIKGSFGYLDPEYFTSLQLTEKSDVYSFGVVLLEVLCARPAIITSDKDEEVNLAHWGRLWQKKGQLEKIIDPILVGNIRARSLQKFGETAEKCLREEGHERPSMHDVLWDLKFALGLHQHGEPKGDTDSMINASSEFELQCSPVEQDDPSPGCDDQVTVASNVFTELRNDSGR
uniref:Putative receptor-like protein kinase At5g24010 n=1 Tax=Rhizophora mucronata TaxID=61149 RepID=A0A2P2QNY9_RHIMU